MNRYDNNIGERVPIVEIDFYEIRDRFLQARREAQWRGQPILDRLASKEWSKGSKGDRWTGGSGADTERWLRDGFNAETFTLNELEVQPRTRSRAHWSEDDGDIDPGRLYGGSDEYMLTQAQREVLPGVSVEIEYDFAKETTTSIQQYGQWLARLLASMETAGYDLDVALIVRSTDLFKKQAEGARTDLRIVVKRGGEISNFTSWSAIFAPTGFRHLVFTAYGLAAEALNQTLANGLGGPVTTGWGCTKDGHLISITCDSRGSMGFPLEQLTAEAREAGLFQ